MIARQGWPEFMYRVLKIVTFIMLSSILPVYP